jgi:hypothetical protein
MNIALSAQGGEEDEETLEIFGDPCPQGDTVKHQPFRIGACLVDHENAGVRARRHVHQVVASSRGGDHQQLLAAFDKRWRAFILVRHHVPRRGHTIGTACRHHGPVLVLRAVKRQTVDGEIRFLREHVGDIRSLVIVEPEDTFDGGADRHRAISPPLFSACKSRRWDSILLS